MSAANDSAPVQPDPLIRVLRGEPTDTELAALVAVLSGKAGGPRDVTGAGATVPPVRDLWGHPVDKLRYSVFSWQAVTQVERTHVRR